MCGINGFNWRDPGKIEEMNRAVFHRGPDDSGTYVDKNVSLGHQRLSIIDLSEKAHQPMMDESGRYVIVYNGEIYNFHEIKKELVKRGFNFFSTSDTEVVLKSYIRWGNECVKFFNGMWAFAIYDKKERKIFLSRDRFGIKPLYYFNERGKFIFSSEIKGILVHDFVTRRVDERTLFNYLFLGISDWDDRTFFAGVKRLTAGSNAIYDVTSGELSVERYYRLEENIRSYSGKNPEEDFFEIFKDAVSKRLIADVKVGSCLSGGLDSTSIVCTMRYFDDKREIPAYSLVFPGYAKDESRFQEEVEKQCRVKRKTTTFGIPDILRDLDDLIATQEEPFPTLSIYGQYRVMKLAHEDGAKVLLDGQGSDELLGGYFWLYSYYLKELLLKGDFLKFIKELNSFKKIHNSLRSLRGFPVTLFPQKLLFSVYTRNETPFLSGDFIDSHIDFLPPLKWRKKSFKEISLYAETVSSLPVLLRFEDRNSMRWAVESRVPFVDHRLAELILSLPPEEILFGGVTKKILRKSMKGIIPEEIRLRSDKVGFEAPDKELLKTEKGKEILTEITNDREFQQHLFWNHEKIKEAANKIIEDKSDAPEYIWKIILVELWLKKFKMIV